MNRIVAVVAQPSQSCTLEWHSTAVFFQPIDLKHIQRRIAAATIKNLGQNSLMLIQINNFFTYEEGQSARDEFKRFNLDTKIYTRMNVLGLPICTDQPSLSFSYTTGRQILEESNNFVSKINELIAWLATETKSHIKLYTSRESHQFRMHYTDSAFICNKLFTLSDDEAQTSFHHDYPKTKNNGGTGQEFNFTLTIFITSESFDDPNFGTQFRPDPAENPLTLPCNHMQIAIFNGDVSHGFCPSKSTTITQDNWCASVTWKCKATPTIPTQSLKLQFEALLWPKEFERNVKQKK